MQAVGGAPLGARCSKPLYRFPDRSPSHAMPARCTDAAGRAAGSALRHRLRAPRFQHQHRAATFAHRFARVRQARRPPHPAARRTSLHSASCQRRPVRRGAEAHVLPARQKPQQHPRRGRTARKNECAVAPAGARADLEPRLGIPTRRRQSSDYPQAPTPIHFAAQRRNVSKGSPLPDLQTFCPPTGGAAGYRSISANRGLQPSPQSTGNTGNTGNISHNPLMCRVENCSQYFRWSKRDREHWEQD